MTVSKYMFLLAALIALVSCGKFEKSVSTDVSSLMVPFAESRYETIRKISGRRDIPIPQEFHELMRAAVSADWPTVSNKYDHLWRRSHWFEGTEPADPRFVNELWHPLHETFWTFNYLMELPQELIHEYCEAILTSLPSDSLVFTGSDSSRFILGSFAPAFGRSDIAFVSQNTLADNSYMDYMQDMYGDKLWFPNEDQRNQTFVRFVESVRDGSMRHPGAIITTNNGQVSVSGVAGVMMINGLLAKMIVQSNAEIRIFVDEAYIIPWMTPFMKPHGLVTELMPEPVTAISQRDVDADMKYWNDIEKRLAASHDQADLGFSPKAYAMMRTTIAGIYAYHELYEEAAIAFRQAMRMAPEYPESAFRLATQVLAPQERFSEAADILRRLQTEYPENRKYETYIEKLGTRDPTEQFNGF